MSRQVKFGKGLYNDNHVKTLIEEVSDLEAKVAIGIDSAYVEGMRTGWNMAQGLSDESPYFPNDKNKVIKASNARITAAFHAALESRRREIRAAKS